MRSIEFTHKSQTLTEAGPVALVPALGGAAVGAMDLLALSLGFASIVALQTAVREDPDQFSDSVIGVVNLYNQGSEWVNSLMNNEPMQSIPPGLTSIEDFRQQLRSNALAAARENMQGDESSIQLLQNYLDALQSLPADQADEVLDTFAPSRPSSEDVSRLVDIEANLSFAQRALRQSIENELRDNGIDLSRRQSEALRELSMSQIAEHVLRQAGEDPATVNMSNIERAAQDFVSSIGAEQIMNDTNRIFGGTTSSDIASSDTDIEAPSWWPDSVPWIRQPQAAAPTVDFDAPSISTPAADMGIGAVDADTLARLDGTDSDIENRTAPTMGIGAIDADTLARMSDDAVASIAPPNIAPDISIDVPPMTAPDVDADDVLNVPGIGQDVDIQDRDRPMGLGAVDADRLTDVMSDPDVVGAPASPASDQEPDVIDATPSRSRPRDTPNSDESSPDRPTINAPAGPRTAPARPSTIRVNAPPRAGRIPRPTETPVAGTETPAASGVDVAAPPAASGVDVAAPPAVAPVSQANRDEQQSNTSRQPRRGPRRGRRRDLDGVQPGRRRDIPKVEPISYTPLQIADPLELNKWQGFR